MTTVQRLEVGRDKIVAYLLNPASKRGASKAKFFLARGFRLDDWESLASALAAQGFENWPGTSGSTPFGTKHAVIGPLLCPDRSSPDILTVWMVRPGSATASLVTAFRTESSARSVDDCGSRPPASLTSEPPHLLKRRPDRRSPTTAA